MANKASHKRSQQLLLKHSKGLISSVAQSMAYCNGKTDGSTACIVQSTAKSNLFSQHHSLELALIEWFDQLEAKNALNIGRLVIEKAKALAKKQQITISSIASYHT